MPLTFSDRAAAPLPTSPSEPTRTRFGGARRELWLAPCEDPTNRSRKLSGTACWNWLAAPPNGVPTAGPSGGPRSRSTSASYPQIPDRGTHDRIGISSRPGCTSRTDCCLRAALLSWCAPLRPAGSNSRCPRSTSHSWQVSSTRTTAEPGDPPPLGWIKEPPCAHRLSTWRYPAVALLIAGVIVALAGFFIFRTRCTADQNGFPVVVAEVRQVVE